MQDKCCRYWPAQGCEGYGSLEVTLLHQTMTDTYSEATLSLRSLAGGEVYTSLPGLPIYHYAPLSFLPLLGAHCASLQADLLA